MEIKENTHLVLKRKYITEALTETEYEIFGMLIDKIANYSESDGKYIICNWDEPYAQEVLDLILEREEQKEL